MHCWHCSTVITVVHVQCPACNEVQPPSPTVSPFERLGLTATFDLDSQTVETAWLRHTRIIHPDRMANRSDRSRRHAAEHAATLNDAQRLLSDPFSRAEWLLRAAAVPVPTAPQHLLMSLMEAREAAEDVVVRPAVIADGQRGFAMAMAVVAAGFGHQSDAADSLARAAAALGEAKMWARLVADIGGPALVRGFDR
jgi:DnaJ-domain-containing protein 1